MSQTNVTGELREFLSKAEQLGFKLIGFNGGGHPRLHNADLDVTYTAPATPSDWRSMRNCLATMERISGRKLPRSNAARYHHQGSKPVLDVNQTDEEKQLSVQIDALLDEADQLRDQFHELAKSEVKDFRVATEARTIMNKYEIVRNALADLHRTIPGIEREEP